MLHQASVPSLEILRPPWPAGMGANSALNWLSVYTVHSKNRQRGLVGQAREGISFQTPPQAIFTETE